MSMNCLTCQALPRTQSDRENNNNIYAYETSSARGRGKSCCLYVTRRWSADLTPTSYQHIKTTTDAREGCSSRKSFSDKKAKDRYLCSDSRNENENENEPRLVRSSGMRRDWSFEDLRLRDQKKGRFH